MGATRLALVSYSNCTLSKKNHARLLNSFPFFFFFFRPAPNLVDFVEARALDRSTMVLPLDEVSLYFISMKNRITQQQESLIRGRPYSYRPWMSL